MSKIGILGATGAVGRQMMQSLIEQDIRVDELRLFASSRSSGKTLPFKDTDIPLQVASESSFEGLDYVLGAVSNDLSKQYRPMIEKANTVYIDNSSAFRLEDNVPLVIPEINGQDAFNHHGIIANPNCSTIITYMALYPIHKLSPLKAVYASTYQAVSGAGNQGIEELKTQVSSLLNDQPITSAVFPTQIAYNCIPQIGSPTENDYTSEEMKMLNEGRKILHAPDLKVNCTCVRVPVFRSHSISVTAITKDKLDLNDIIRSLKQAKGVIYEDQDIVTPLQTSNQDNVYVSRIRRDLVNENGITLWCCGDQIRKGAASNAVAIIKLLES